MKIKTMITASCCLVVVGVCGYAWMHYSFILSRSMRILPAPTAREPSRDR